MGVRCVKGYGEMREVLRHGRCVSVSPADCPRQDLTVNAGVRPIVETFPLSKFPEAYDKLLNGSPNLRCVITFE